MSNSCDVFVAATLQAVVLVALCFGITACNGILGGASKSSTSPSPAVSVQVTPAEPTVVSGGKLQLGAMVTGTSNPAVTWSATGGSITTSGLFTAPVATGTVTVTASSVAASAAASVTVTVTPRPSKLAIATSSLAGGMAGTTYIAALAGNGGTPPYAWSLASGALPSGMQLNASTGVISGITAQAGTSAFTVRLLDQSGSAVSQALQLVMTSQTGSNCGPPSYLCSRTDTKVIVAKAPPQLGANLNYRGGTRGAGIVAVDPAYNNRILRVTDGYTDATRPGESYANGSSAERNVTSYDESMFIIHNGAGEICLYQFDAASFSAKFHGCHNNVGQSLDFGYTTANQHAFYSYHEEKLYRFVVDPANWTIAADPTFNNGLGYFDPDNANCLNGQIAANHWYTGDSGLSSDDNTMIVAVGPAQDENPYYVVWNATKGCQWMNVQTWQVSQGWNTGLRNPRKIAWASGSAPTQPGGIHNAQIDRSGASGVLTINGTSLDHKVFWTIGTNQVDDTCASCNSHWACDFGVCFWDMGPGSGYSLQQQEIGSLNPVLDIDPEPVEGQWGNDEHMSHANATQGKKLIYLAAWQPGLGGSSVNQVFEDELIGVNWDGSQRTIRFNKDWDSGYGGFNGSVRCSISRQGNYAICNSDLQMYNLDKGFGNGLNQDTCDHTQPAGVVNTTSCRTDVLLFELR